MPQSAKSNEADEALSKQSLKAAVWYTVTKIAQEEELSLPFAASEHFVATLAEVVYQQALSLGKDLERFAKHAGRMTINADDVKLAARRNEPLFELLSTSAQQQGLTLADIRADSAASKASGSGRGKQVKAPRLSTTKGVAPKKEDGVRTGAKSREAATSKSKATPIGSKGKGKQRDIDTGEDDARDEDDEGDEPKLREIEPELGGGFVKASALKLATGKKPKTRKRVAVDSDDEEEQSASGDDSEEVRSKRHKRKGETGRGKVKRRKLAGSDSD